MCREENFSLLFFALHEGKENFASRVSSSSSSFSLGADRYDDGDTASLPLSLVTVRKSLLFLLPLCEVPSSSLSPGFFVRPVFCRRRRRNFASSAFPLSLFPKTLCVYNVESEKSGPNCDMKKRRGARTKEGGELRPIVVRMCGQTAAVYDFTFMTSSSPFRVTGVQRRRPDKRGEVEGGQFSSDSGGQ